MPSHPLTEKLLSEIPSTILLYPSTSCVKSIRPITAPTPTTPPTTLIELQIQPVDPSSPYSSKPWVVLIGGPGLGCKDELFGSKRPPVAVRLGSTCCFGLAGVDELGFFPEGFWEEKYARKIGGGEEVTTESLFGLGGSLSLSDIVDNVVLWFESGHLVEDESCNDWLRYKQSRAYTAEKLQTIKTFQEKISQNPAISGPENNHLLPEFLAPSFRSFLSDSPPSKTPTLEHLKDSISLTSPSPQVYSFPLLTPAFCSQLVDEIDLFESSSLPRRRPNTMNKYGLVVNEIGWEGLMDQLLDKVIRPLTPLLFPSLTKKFEGAEQQGGKSLADGEPLHCSYSYLDHHHTFIVEYKSKYTDVRDHGLDMHEDDSEVTMNVCLGRVAKTGSPPSTATAGEEKEGDGGGEKDKPNFSGSLLRFCGQKESSLHRKEQLTLEHEIGTAVLHLGRQRHGADNILDGERVNLIIWARSSGYRANLAYGHLPLDVKGVGEADLVCLSKANDRDYVRKVQELGGGDSLKDAPVVHKKDDGSVLGFDTFTKKAKTGKRASCGRQCTKF